MFNCNAYPRLDTYEKAVAHFNNVKPMARGDCVGFKPIHLRTHYHKYDMIQKWGDDVVFVTSWNPVHATLGDNDVIVRWKPNGEIHVRPPMYNCMYERLTSLFGLHCFRKDSRLWVQTYTVFALRRRDDDQPSIFKQGTTGSLEYVNPPPLTQKALNRGVAKAVRGKYQVIYDYLRSMTKVRDEVYTNSELAEAFDIELKDPRMHPWHMTRHMPRMSDRDAIVERISLAMEGDVSELYKLMLICANENGFVSYWNQESPLTCSPSKVVKAFDDFILKLHREEVFYDKEVPVGKMPNTANNKYFA